MDIRFSQLDFAYNALTREFEEENYSADKRADISRCFHFPPVPLPWPLDEGVLSFRRNEDVYSAHFSFLSTRKSIFRNISNRLNERFKQKWSQMNKHGIGYLIENGEPYISMSSICENTGRLIALGSFGARPLEVKDSGDFGLHLTNLEKIANIYIDCCLSPLLKDSKIPPLPEHPIYISA